MLEVLVWELGVDHEEGWQRVLGDARENWRRTQIKAAVRDDPAAAYEVLCEIGYTIEPPTDGHAPPYTQALRSI